MELWCFGDLPPRPQLGEYGQSIDLISATPTVVKFHCTSPTFSFGTSILATPRSQAPPSRQQTLGR